ncbi:MAG: tetratricopeptide repeat protein [Desulfovibrio sp.]|jgi:tetratricopeptide (TPR) repeat protein/GGDEF domain-containing protein|nr:tetratricopeptide repeat protein [Desulfovibrio sp.]
MNKKSGHDIFAEERILSGASPSLGEIPAGPRAVLTRRDIISFEQRLKEAVRSLIPFKAYSIHFPRASRSRLAEPRPEEDKILLPIAVEEGEDFRLLGVFVARGADLRRAAPLLEHWPALGALIADNLLQYKRSLCDPLTALFSLHTFLERLARSMDCLRFPLPPAGRKIRPEEPRPAEEGLVPDDDETPRRAPLGVLAVRFGALELIAREHGSRFADGLLVPLADAVGGLCPEQGLAARVGDSEFALLLPAATAKECRRLGEDIARAVRSVPLALPLGRGRVGIAATVGFSLYPRDMGGDAFLRPAEEQARILLRQAGLAAALADEARPFLSPPHGGEPVLPFQRILSEGGRILEILPLSRVAVNVGSRMQAREGQRFAVWSFPGPDPAAVPSSAGTTVLAPKYKGEIVLVEVRDDTSQAEILSLGDPVWNMEPGDRLILQPEEEFQSPLPRPGGERRDAASGFLRHGDFFARWAQDRERCGSFVLALLRLGPPFVPEVRPGGAGGEDGESSGPETAPPGPGFSGPDKTPLTDSYVAGAVRLCREAFGRGVLGGRFSLNSLILFHPDLDGPSALDAYRKLAAGLGESLGLEAAAGLAGHPCLNFRKADAVENSRKALEYALLLPEPHVGLLDSLALNIAADKLFSRGDLFGAIKEYQQALLADEDNGMAWNSLGICLAGIGRQAEAERHFARALACDPEDVMALYNLGYMCQARGQLELARGQYLQCLVHAPRHLFATLRLGQLAEIAGDPAGARRFYEKAAALPGGYPLTCRYLARLSLSEGNPGLAREYLHEALVYDPQDALSLQLLARLSLEAGEDPDMAASLARQSVSLRPGLKAGWLDLARALQVMGRTRQAREARLKAGEV